jgi:hypothetical protein
MAAVESAATEDGGPQMSTALCDLLKVEAEQQAAHHRTATAQSDAPSEPARPQSHGSGDLDLGQLDITSSDVSLDGLDEQLDKFADHEVVRAILDQVQRVPALIMLSGRRQPVLQPSSADVAAQQSMDCLHQDSAAAHLSCCCRTGVRPKAVSQPI